MIPEIEMTDLVRKHFINWNQPPLSATADLLSRQFANERELDLSGVMLVMPTTRAGYRLQELLIDISEQHELIFTPPMTTTIGNVPELLYRPSRPLASALAQSLAWVQALQQTPSAELRQFTRLIPQVDDMTTWRTLGALLSSWHQELASDGLMFPDVLKAGEQVEVFQEHKRWQALDKVQRRYLDVLHNAGLWDQQSARLVAIEKNECSTDKQVFLIGLVDLNTVFRKILTQITSQVTAVVFGDPEQQDWFDNFGCLDHKQWQKSTFDIRDDDILLVDQPGDLAKMLVCELRRLAGNYLIDEIGVSVPDASMVSPITQTLADQHIRTFDTRGSSIGNTRPFVMLELVIAWLSAATFESFAKLVRHPDMYDWIVRKTGNDHWLSELDQYQNNRLPFFFSTDAAHQWFGDTDLRGRPVYANLEQVYQVVLQLVQTVFVEIETGGTATLPETKSMRPLAEWSNPWRNFLVSIYSERVLDQNSVAERRTLRACQILMRSFVEMEQSGSLLAKPVAGTDAIQWVLAYCSGEFIVDPAPENSLALAGWLDTPWDETPVAMLTSINEGHVPSSENSSLFIPNSIRTQLGLVDNLRRYSRDAWSLGLIINSRRITKLFVLRKNEDGDPMLPSRLLLTGDPQRVALRAKRLFGEIEMEHPGGPTESANRPQKQQLVIPRPATDTEPINSMRVTDFKAYLQCPYRFYLTRVLRLGRLADTAEELDGARFGSLLHDVVENFGRSENKNSADAQVIEAYVLDCLDRFAQARFGRLPMPAVSVQLAQARLRLKAFAEWQADHRRDAYEIFEVEREKTRFSFDVDGQPFEIRGQIDRIDVNHQRKTIGVFDYKTNDQRKGPREYHQTKQQEWTDLQLPLYKYLLNEFDLPCDYKIEYGLILLARDTNKIYLEVADWSDAELHEARELALEIMRDVRAGKFWPPADKNVPSYLDDFAAICQTSVFQRWLAEDSGDVDSIHVTRPDFAIGGVGENRSDEGFESGNSFRSRL